LRRESERLPLIWLRQGLVSQTMGILPPWLAATRLCSRSSPFTAAASLKPRELNSMPQHELDRPCKGERTAT